MSRLNLRSMTTLTVKPFDCFSDLNDGFHFFSSNLMFNNKIIYITSSIVIEDGVVVGCNSLVGDGFRGNREVEHMIRKAIIWILNESAEFVTLDSGYTVFVPLVFNMYRKRR